MSKNVECSLDRVYSKYKLQVKKWEKEFKEIHSRIPSKFDIREAPPKVRYAYKQYFHLKSAALEDSLTEYQFDEDVFAGSPEFAHLPDVNSDCSDNLNLPSSSQIEKLLKDAGHKSQVIVPVEEKVTHSEECVKPAVLPTIEVIKSDKLLTKSSFSPNLSQKLFMNSKFQVRNPRKSSTFRSQTKVDTSEPVETVSDDQIPNVLIDNCILPVVPDQVCNVLPESLSFDYSKLNVTGNKSLRSIDSGWLTRCDPTINETTSILDTPSMHTQSNCNNIFGLKNVSIHIDPSSQLADYVENSESETDILNDSASKLKPTLKKRKLDIHNDSFEIKPDSSNLSIDKEPARKYKSKIGNDSHTKVGNLVSSEDEQAPKKNKKGILKKTLKSRKVKVQGNSQKNIKQESIKKPGRRVLSRIKKKEKDNLAGDVENRPSLDDFMPMDVNEVIQPRYHMSNKGVVEKLHNLSQTTGLSIADEKTKCLASRTKTASAEDKLAAKIASGTLNDNFVKINIEKKVFVRGRKNRNFSSFKKQQWKDKKKMLSEMEFPAGGKAVCFKCGLTGHMSRYCTAHRGDQLLPLQATTDDTLPTLKDIECSKVIQSVPISVEQETEKLYKASIVPISFMELLKEPTVNQANEDPVVQPLYSELTETPAEVYEALKLLGHTAFRPGQEGAIRRILSGLSTLLILSTGSGKSLCYQLPAYLYSNHYKCITLVISPLVSLMEDQVLSMPEFLKAGCLHTNQTPTQRKKIFELLKEGHLNILLISPEALICGDRSTGFGNLFKQLPPIAFACIDEAHCISQWSHNFRPSYLMICRVLREKLKVKCILGLTATATKPAIDSIINYINITDGWSGVITNPALPENLVLTVSFDNDKDRSLITLLSSERFESCNSIIVYCIRRDECERIAALLRSSLQEPGKVNVMIGTKNKKRKRTSILSEAYHAGMSAAQRRRIQESFMCGQLRIIVATVAFGMGINKSDIRAVIHYNIPSNFESYVQEVGRAGRDGLIAHCHVFMSKKSNDKDELLKHIHANTIDRHTLRALLQKVFIPCKCKEHTKEQDKVPANERCLGHEVAFSIDETVEEFDIPPENISTLLCYLELHHKQHVRVLNNSYVTCKIFSYGHKNSLRECALKCPPLAMALALESKKGGDVSNLNSLEFGVVDVAAAIGWDSGITKYHLKNLEWKDEGGMKRRSQFKVEFNNLGFRIKAPGDLSPTELDEMLDSLHDRVQNQEKTRIYQLEEIIDTFSRLSADSVYSCCSLSEVDSYKTRSDKLKIIVRDYFKRDNLIRADLELEVRPVNEARAISDIQALISSYRDCTFTGRAIARIFQGINSPNYPALVWGRCRFWRSHLHESFHELARLATKQIIHMR